MLQVCYLNVAVRSGQDEITFAAINFPAQIVPTRNATTIEDRCDCAAPKAANDCDLVGRRGLDIRTLIHHTDFLLTHRKPRLHGYEITEHEGQRIESVEHRNT
jgi:hypothetical protein